MKWIKLSDKKPKRWLNLDDETHHQFLIAEKDGTIHVAQYIDWRDKADEKEPDFVIAGTHRPEYIWGAVWWAELPKPPEEE